MHKFYLAVLLTALLTTNASADLVAPGAGFAIPDNNAAGASSSIQVNLAVDEIIKGVSVSLIDFNHAWIGDLNATLTGPGGSVDLMIRTGRVGVGAGDDSDVAGFYVFTDVGADWWNAAASVGPFTPITQGVYAPSTTNGAAQSFAGTFDGTLINGLWTLNIADRNGGEVGSLGSWTLSIRSNPVPEPTALGLFAVAACGIALIRRRKR